MLWAVGGLFAVDGLVFRTGWYAGWMHPDSSTGHYERLIVHEREQSKAGGKRVLVLGDSRTGFLARVADERTAGRIRFGNAALGGTTPRCWYYLLRDMDPRANAYAAIVVPFGHYEDEEAVDDLRNRTGDLHFLAERLRLTDAPAFVSSVSSLQAHVQTVRALLWKGFLYNRDVQDLLRSPARRAQTIETYRNWAEWVYGYQGEARSLEGLQVDYPRRKITFPAGLDERARAELVEALLWEPFEPKGWMYEYRMEWIGKIAERYRGTGTKLIFMRLPRGPVPRPVEWGRAKTSAVREIAKREGAVLAPEGLFEELEQPRLFVDGRHLNSAGMTRFSELIADLVLGQGL
ncbi:MAG: hypothetical protein U0R19_04500 [Bryobacteraceae bacterium]